jgi:pimeloyl-ACP methyl ester carboxylesterase
MSDEQTKKARAISAAPDDKGRPTFLWRLTSTSLNDVVKLVLPPTQSLPIIFVPGIMGSNLCNDDGEPVWLLNGKKKPVGLLFDWITEGAGVRQQVLHPDRTRVYGGGTVPEKPVGTVLEPSEYKKRGWGQVSQSSYQEFLLWLETTLNDLSNVPDPSLDIQYDEQTDVASPKAFHQEALRFKAQAQGTDGTVSKKDPDHPRFRYPVYAFGYNWLSSNEVAADALSDRIDEVIKENNRGRYKCSQVILVTHSMGGLVARACIGNPGVTEKVAGVVHGVMPAVGAAVAYRRCKVGMLSEDATTAAVIGMTGQEVTAVFAQAPGALQLLPSSDYGKNWLQFRNELGKVSRSLPLSDPYKEIYLVKDKWWGLVNEAWLSPKGGVAINWNVYVRNIALAKSFHEQIAEQYHQNTHVFYGDSDGKCASFENVRWGLKRGLVPTRTGTVLKKPTLELSHQEVREIGITPIYVGGESEVVRSFSSTVGTTARSEIQTSIWELHCEKQDARGDGTVPAKSGKTPIERAPGRVQKQHALSNIPHEGAFRELSAKQVTRYSIMKISANAKV